MKKLKEFLVENNLKKTTVKNWLKKDKCYKLDNSKIVLPKDCEERLLINIDKTRGSFSLKQEYLDGSVDEYFAYFLGIMWSDGYISKDKNYSISLSVVESDYNYINNVLSTIGNWKTIPIVPSIKNPKWQKQIRSYMYNKNSHNLLSSLGFYDKSFNDFNHIINYLPNKFIPHFIRGVVDGDGCFYYNVKNNKKYNKFTISNNSNYDWSNFCNILDQIGIVKYHLVCKVNSISKNSTLTINRKDDIIKLGSFIYKNYDGIGYTRKYNKFLFIKNNL